ncbi:hypothetical protein BH11PAT2_BH11PAT2_06530 [soil metagenome]
MTSDRFLRPKPRHSIESHCRDCQHSLQPPASKQLTPLPYTQSTIPGNKQYENSTQKLFMKPSLPIRDTVSIAD